MAVNLRTGQIISDASYTQNNSVSTSKPVRSTRKFPRGCFIAIIIFSLLFVYVVLKIGLFRTIYPTYSRENGFGWVMSMDGVTATFYQPKAIPNNQKIIEAFQTSNGSAFSNIYSGNLEMKEKEDDSGIDYLEYKDNTVIYLVDDTAAEKKGRMISVYIIGYKYSPGSKPRVSPDLMRYKYRSYNGTRERQFNMDAEVFMFKNLFAGSKDRSLTESFANVPADVGLVSSPVVQKIGSREYLVYEGTQGSSEYMKVWATYDEENGNLIYITASGYEDNRDSLVNMVQGGSGLSSIDFPQHFLDTVTYIESELSKL